MTFNPNRAVLGASRHDSHPFFDFREIFFGKIFWGNFGKYFFGKILGNFLAKF